MSYKFDLDSLGLIFKKIKETMVAKEAGKGLSTNDYTDEEKAKVADIPSKTSDLENDSGFITTSDIPEGSAASTTSPKMAGTAAVGEELAFARGDHVHPSDTSRVPTSRTINGKELTDDITLSAEDVGAATADDVENAKQEVLDSIAEDGYLKDSDIATLTTEAVDTAWTNA